MILAVTLIFKVKIVPPEFWAVARYNALVLPAVLLADTLLGYGFISACRAGWNLPLVVAGQIFVYQVAVFILSRFLLRQELPNFFWAMAAFLLMAFGIGILSGSQK